MRKTKRLGALLGCTIMAIAVVGCGKKEEAEVKDSTIEVNAETPSWKVDTASADLDWYINFDWFSQSWGEDVATKYITEDTNVNITYLSGGDDKLNTMLASDDLPDIITIDNANPVIKDAAKFAMPLDELAEKYDPYFLKHAAKEDTVAFFTQDDGHIYGYPNFSTSKKDYEEGGVYGNQAFMVREDIYEQIGRPDMSTPEGFLAALEAVQQLGLKDGLGKDIIPFGMADFASGVEKTGIFDKTLADFLGVPVLNEDGTLYDRQTDEDFMLWVKTMAEARRKGYTDQDMLTMVQADKDARLSNGSYFVYFASDVIAETSPISVWTADHPDQPYIAIDGPASTVGREIALTGSSIEGWTLTFISKSCKNPQKAMELITYLVSEEGDTVMNYGREGETYTMVDGKPVLNKDLLELKQTDPGKFEVEIGLTTHLWLQDSVRLSKIMGIDQFPKGLQQAKAWTQDKVVPQFEVAMQDSELSKEAARSKEKIQQNWEQTISIMMDSKDDGEIDKALEDFISYRTENGYEQLTKERNEKIADNIKKLK